MVLKAPDTRSAVSFPREKTLGNYGKSVRDLSRIFTGKLVGSGCIFLGLLVVTKKANCSKLKQIWENKF